MRPPKITIFVYFAVFLIGIFLGWAVTITWFKYHDSSLTTIRPHPIREGQEGLINPLLSCEFSEKKIFEEFQPLEYKIQNLIEEKTKNNQIKYVAIYFRDFNNGHWTGYNENENFFPASLLKVATMIAYFKKAESDPSTLNQHLTFQGFEAVDKQTIKPKKTLQEGVIYTVNDLINRMIVNSDNNASRLLFKNIGQEAIYDLYSDLGIVVPKEYAMDNFMSPKSYSLLFRVLYNSTYLNKGNSEKALELLAKTDFKNGLIAGLPPKVTVSHKFGENEKDNLKKNTKQLHDCGIIYVPNHPYFLCVMTKGNNFQDMEKIIADISRLIYQEVSKL